MKIGKANTSGVDTAFSLSEDQPFVTDYSLNVVNAAAVMRYAKARCEESERYRA